MVENTPIMLQIIYASTSGNVQLVCEFAAKNLYEKYQIESTLHRAEVTSIDTILGNDHFILATSTWEHGEINPFWNKLLAELSRQDMHGKKAAFIGLGDKRYESVLFCKGIDILQEAFMSRGGETVGEVLKIEGEPHHQLETIVLPWTQQVAELLKN